MGSLLAMIDKRTKINISSSDLKSPRIVIISDEKSSALDHLIGYAFLPKDSEPAQHLSVVVKMIKGLEDDDRRRQYAFSATDDFAGFEGDERAFRMSKVRDEIERFTNEKCDNKKRVWDDLMCLKVYSAEAADFSSVDLPNSTQVAGDDHLPKNVEQIKRIVIKYTEDADSFIFVVSTTDPEEKTEVVQQNSSALAHQDGISCMKTKASELLSSYIKGRSIDWAQLKTRCAKELENWSNEYANSRKRFKR